MKIELVPLIAEYGVKNIRFRIPMRPLEMAGFIPGVAFKSSNTPAVPVLCFVDESRYHVTDNYKITLKQDVELAASGEAYCGSENFYICDLERIIERDPAYEVYAVTIDGFQKLFPSPTN